MQSCHYCDKKRLFTRSQHRFFGPHASGSTPDEKLCTSCYARKLVPAMNFQRVSDSGIRESSATFPVSSRYCSQRAKAAAAAAGWFGLRGGREIKAAGFLFRQTEKPNPFPFPFPSIPQCCGSPSPHYPRCHGSIALLIGNSDYSE